MGKFKAGDLVTIELTDERAEYWNQYGLDKNYKIIKHESAPFDWSTANPGMCFTNKCNKYWYVGPRLGNKDEVCMSDISSFPLQENMWHFSKHILNRSPEHDIEVPHAN